MKLLFLIVFLVTSQAAIDLPQNNLTFDCCNQNIPTRNEKEKIIENIQDHFAMAELGQAIYPAPGKTFVCSAQCLVPKMENEVITPPG